MFIKYPKVKRLGDEDTDGILFGTVYVQEKIDGANASIWLEDGEIKCGSRTQDVTTKGFNGLVEYAKSHEGIRKYLEVNRRHRLFGEWLVRHTIAYKETAYKNFYLFDILIEPEEWNVQTAELVDEQEADRRLIRQCKWLTIPEVHTVAKAFEITTPELFTTLVDPTPEALQEYVGKTTLGVKGEGICLKNPEFINKWGDRCVAKIVTQEFKEDNAIVFGGNNKHSETYVEMKMVNEFMTMSRVQKIMNKLEPIIGERLDMKHTSRIITTAYHDMFEEEMWAFVKEHPVIDFRSLRKLAEKKAARIYHDILNNHISVAYAENLNGSSGIARIGEDNVGKEEASRGKELEKSE